MRSKTISAGAPATPWKAYTALGFGVLCIGLSAIFVKIAGAPGTVSAFYRVFFASLILVPLWLLRGPRLPGPSVLQATALGGVFFVLDLALWNSALLHRDAKEDRLGHRLATLCRPKLLILDEMGYFPLDRMAALITVELMDCRFLNPRLQFTPA